MVENGNLYMCSPVYMPLPVHIWVNYNDLTATSLESWLIRGIIPTWLYFRLVNYCNLPILLDLRKKTENLSWWMPHLETHAPQFGSYVQGQPGVASHVRDPGEDCPGGDRIATVRNTVVTDGNRSKVLDPLSAKQCPAGPQAVHMAAILEAGSVLTWVCNRVALKCAADPRNSQCICWSREMDVLSKVQDRLRTVQRCSSFLQRILTFHLWSPYDGFSSLM